jgi:hypothetical protein
MEAHRRQDAPREQAQPTEQNAGKSGREDAEENREDVPLVTLPHD